MLLLLLTDVYEPITLDNLFHISTGLLEDKHERFIEQNNEQRKVWFLHMGDMRANDGLIDFENLAQNESDLINNRLKREKKKANGFIILTTEKLRVREILKKTNETEKLKRIQKLEIY